MAAAAATHGSFGFGVAGSGGQSLAFRRLQLETLSHEAPAPLQGPGGGTTTALGARLIRFDHLAPTDPATQKPQVPPCSGIFLSGSRPLWLVASRGGLVPHPMFVEGAVAGLTPFHNVNCPLGFITACSSRGQLKVCVLPQHCRLDGPWVTRRVPLRATPHRLAWFREGGLLAAITSRIVPSRPRPPEEPGGDPHASAAYAAAAAAALARGREEAWEVRLLDAGCGCARVWSSGLLPPGEQALSVRVVRLRNGATGDTDTFLAVGTGSPMGEDYPCLGRILLYGISSDTVDLGGGNVSRRWGGQLLAAREMASAVTSVQEFRSQLLVSCGHRVELYEWRGGPAGLDKRAFFDLPSLVVGLVAVKDYLLAADASQGLHFVRYSDAARVLEFMSKEFDPRDCVAAGVLICEPKLAFLAADAAGSLSLAEFYGARNTNPAFWAGQRLAPLGSLHVARLVSSCVSIKMATADGKNRHALLCGSAEGGLSYIAPIADPAAVQRLAAVQTHLSRSLPHVAGLNPRSFRHRFCRIPRFLGGGASHHPPPPVPGSSSTAGGGGGAGGGLLDGQLLSTTLPYLTRGQLAAAAEAAGAAPGQLLADLRALIAAATFG
ncbi:hypothetical protein Agub_g7531 [Astrephomene gubernaculifera]|uniref:Cleavage/polyadenylation specificity factor A subunit C-terminal domain-containing protein n=1 Tax=Astrephomene gubernaculifera TaxID=47775 RepID=A0AAD3DQ86_9CHLO|nr:hypothetical protein Agub_g7531 [Astrephomene gubernaculifera]